MVRQATSARPQQTLPPLLLDSRTLKTKRDSRTLKGGCLVLSNHYSFAGNAVWWRVSTRHDCCVPAVGLSARLQQPPLQQRC